MNEIIQLTLHPFHYPIAFETTGIQVVGSAQDRNARAFVNDMEVAESFNEVIFMLKEL